MASTPAPEPAHGRPRTGPTLSVALGALPAALVVQAFVFGAIAVVFLSSGTDADDVEAELEAFAYTPLGFALTMLTTQLVIGGLPLAAAWLSPTPAGQRLGLVPIRAGRLAVHALGVVFVFALGQVVWEALFDVPSDSLLAMDEVFREAPLAAGVVLTLLGSVFPGVCEELLFRGYVQRRLLAAWGPLKAIGFSSVLFACFHLDPQHVLAILPGAFWLGVLAWRTGSTWTTIAGHALGNAIAFGLVVADVGEPTETDWTSTLLLMGLSAPFFALSVALCVRAGAPRAPGAAG